MGPFGKARPHVCDMLREQSRELDRIFGAGTYTVEQRSEYSALLKSKVADILFTDDPRDFVAASITAVPGIDTVESPLDIWTAFLDLEMPPQRRSDSYQRQLANELRSIGIIAERILNDPVATRDAAWFVAGYNRAYNDWASRKGSWSEPDFGD